MSGKPCSADKGCGNNHGRRCKMSFCRGWVSVRNMARHSSFNDVQVAEVGNLPLLPVKCASRASPAAAWTGGDAPDPVDEAIAVFRANVFYRNYEVKGGGDRVLLYLTLFVNECLRVAEKSKSAKDCERDLLNKAQERFSLPDDAGFPLSASAGIIHKPANARDLETMRAYVKLLREETARRLAPLLFNEDGTPNKMWMPFAKKKFLNKSL